MPTLEEVLHPEKPRLNLMVKLDDSDHGCSQCPFYDCEFDVCNVADRMKLNEVHPGYNAAPNWCPLHKHSAVVVIGVIDDPA